MGRRDPLVTEASDHTVYTAALRVVAPVALSGADAQVIFSPQNYFGEKGLTNNGMLLSSNKNALFIHALT